MAEDQIKRYELKKIISELEQYKGRATELISVYIRANSDVNKVVDWLEKEKNPASNIKDSNTRKNVLGALDKIIQFLKGRHKAPENGMVVFCGNVSNRPGVSDIRLFYVEPPEPVQFFKYHCDEQFLLEPLKEMLVPKDVYGVVMMDNESAIIGLIKGNNFEVIKEIEGYFHGKHRAGGQSARRYERLIEQQSHEFKKRVAEECKDVFYKIDGLKGIIIAGPGPTKDDFYRGDYLPGDLKQKVIDVVDISYVDEVAIKEIIHKVGDKLKDVDFVQERLMFEKFFENIVRNTGYSIYGVDEIIEALKMSAVDTILVTEGFTEKNKEVFEEILKLAQETGAKIYIISDKTETGVQLNKTFGGLGAILRFIV